MSLQNSADDKQHFQIRGNCADARTGLSALDLLAQASGLSKAELKNLAQKGAIWLSQIDKDQSRAHKAQRLRRLKRPLSAEQQLDLYLHPTLAAIPLLYEDKPAQLIKDFGSYSVWFKPRGMWSQGSKYGDFQSLPRWIELRSETLFGAPRLCWQIHRLDRATEGLMLIAHSKKSAAQLTHLFESKQIQKTYLANVWGTPSAPQWSSHEPIDDKPALSHFRLVATGTIAGQTASRLEVNIETGRKHQIRKHLAGADLPIIGDRQYGHTLLDAPLTADLQLSAYQLQWHCPQSQTQQTVQLPPAFLSLLTLATAAP